jgi:CheY-like chemotaxis protein
MDKAKILIVDDDVALSRLVQITLENTRLYNVRVENNSHRALAAAIEFHPELILLDVDMPGLDGGEVARKIRASPGLKAAPIIFFTSLISQRDHSETIVSRGDDKFLAKPIEPSTLVRSIETILSGGAQRKAEVSAVRREAP